MQVEILLFASLRDELGPAVPVDVPRAGLPATTVGDVRAAFLAAYPSATRLGRRILVAVNERHASDGDPVRPGDTVAFLPPLAGG